MQVVSQRSNCTAIPNTRHFRRSLQIKLGWVRSNLNINNQLARRFCVSRVVPKKIPLFNILIFPASSHTRVIMSIWTFFDVRSSAVLLTDWWVVIDAVPLRPMSDRMNQRQLKFTSNTVSCVAKSVLTTIFLNKLSATVIGQWVLCVQSMSVKFFQILLWTNARLADVEISGHSSIPTHYKIAMVDTWADAK